MSIIIMILLLGFLILVHEMGHFFAARALGIKVSKFAIGFPIGPTLWSKKIGDVEYLIHACLLGGYVAFPDDEKDSELPADSPQRFANNPVWKRIIVISAGVLTNLIVAFLLVFFVAGIWGELPSGKSEVYTGKIAADKGESVWDSGMQNGDRILTINGSKIDSWYALITYATNSASYDGKINKTFLNDNLEKLMKLNPQFDKNQQISPDTVIHLPEKSPEPELIIDDDKSLMLGIYKDEREKLTNEQINLRDLIGDNKTYKTTSPTTLTDIAYAISDGLSPLKIVVLRDGKEIELKTIYPNKKGLIGIMPEIKPINIQTKTPQQIIKTSSQYLWNQTAYQLYGMYKLFTGKIPAKEMHGIIAVAKVGGDVISKDGLPSGLLLTAIISAWLAILNFLPIPALDGGHFMFLIIEKLRGKPVNEKIIEWTSTVFFVLILVLAFLLIFNDIYALIKHQL